MNESTTAGPSSDGAVNRLLDKHQAVGAGGAAPRGRGRPPGAKNKVVEGVAAPQPMLFAYSPEVGKNVQKTLFGACAVLGHSDRYWLTDAEAELLGPLTSDCLTQFAPGAGQKWVSLSLLSVSMLSVFVAKAQLHRADLKAEAIEAEKKRRAVIAEAEKFAKQQVKEPVGAFAPPATPPEPIAKA